MQSYKIVTIYTNLRLFRVYLQNDMKLLYKQLQTKQ